MASKIVIFALQLCALPVVGMLRTSAYSKGPISDADLKATGDTGYPCVASGPMVEVCGWFFEFVKQNPKPPKSIKEPYIFGGTDNWHTPDEDVTKACQANY